MSAKDRDEFDIRRFSTVFGRQDIPSKQEFVQGVRSAQSDLQSFAIGFLSTLITGRAAKKRR